MITLSELFLAVAGDTKPAASPEFFPDSPWRPHLWRLARAVMRCRAPDSTPAVDGLRRYLCSKRADAAATALSDDTAALSVAIDVAVGDELGRVEVEARVLADQDRGEIALRLQVRPEAIAAFEAFFFDVRPRLRASSWIRHAILKPDPWFVLKRTDVPLLWRWFGYRFGEQVVDWLTQSVVPEELARRGLDAYFDADVPIPDELKALIACKCILIPRTVEEMVRLGALCQQFAATLSAGAVHANLAGPISWSGLGEQPLVLDVRTSELAREILSQVA